MKLSIIYQCSLG